MQTRTDDTIAIFNHNLRKAIRANNSLDCEALLTQGANGMISPTDDPSTETVFKIAADAKHLDLMKFLAQRLSGKAAFTPFPHQSNGWLCTLIKQEKTEYVIAYLDYATGVRTLLTGLITEETEPLIAFYNEALLVAVQYNQMAVVKALLEKGCLGRSEYASDAKTAVTLAKSNKNPQMLALLMKYHLDMESHFIEQTSPLIPDVLDLAMANPHRDHPVFFIIENYLIVKERVKNYDGDFRKKIDTFATILRLMAQPNDPLVNTSHVYAYLKTAYPTNSNSEFRRTCEAIYLYNSLELKAAFDAYQVARQNAPERTLLENSIIEHTFYGSNPLFQCHYYLFITESRRHASPENQTKYERQYHDFSRLLIMLNNESEAIVANVTQLLDEITTTPMTLLGVDTGFRRARFSTFPKLMNALRELGEDDLKKTYRDYVAFLSASHLNPDFTQGMRAVIEKSFLNDESTCILSPN